MRLKTFLVATGLLVSSQAAAQSIVPAPGEAGFDAALAAKVDDHDRVLHEIMAAPLGWGLEAFVPAANRGIIDAYVASGQRDFEAQSGQHIYSVLRAYGEHGDLGMFGGTSAAGDAFRYAHLRDSGAPAAEVDRARDDLLAAMQGMHWYTQVTGVPGVMSRGIRRKGPQSGAPALPGMLPATLPLFDSSGNPQPVDKEPTWREDNSGELPFLIWLDDTSKDQVDGYIFALGAAYDAVAGDSTIPTAAIDTLVEDARAIGLKLTEKVSVGASEADLVLTDADGRPTSFHDMSAEELIPGLVVQTAGNPFNAVMALGAMRTLFHITGDERIGRFYYDELIAARGYMDLAEAEWAITYMGTNTNYSNINMGFVAIYGILRYETDPTIAAQARRVLENQLYAPGEDREARGLKQSLFDVIYAGFGAMGTSGPGQTAVSDALETLEDYPGAPHWNDAVENCDPMELTALSCTAIDGSTIAVSPLLGWNDIRVAVDPLPMAIRPPSNFEWRSDPHRVNGGGGDRLNPAGGFWAAYWLGRLLQSTNDGMDNVSPNGRPAPPPGMGGAGGAAGAAGQSSTGGAPSGGAPGTGGSTGGAGGATATGGDSGGCGCRLAGGEGPSPHPYWALMLAAVAARRRRQRS